MRAAAPGLVWMGVVLAGARSVSEVAWGRSAWSRPCSSPATSTVILFSRREDKDARPLPHAWHAGARVHRGWAPSRCMSWKSRSLAWLVHSQSQSL